MRHHALPGEQLRENEDIGGKEKEQKYVCHGFSKPPPSASRPRLHKGFLAYKHGIAHRVAAAPPHHSVAPVLPAFVLVSNGQRARSIFSGGMEVAQPTIFARFCTRDVLDRRATGIKGDHLA